MIQEELYLNNAGMVLLWPFLAHFFDELAMLESAKLKDNASAERGVFLLQYVVTGDSEAPEPEFVLNKIHCGLSPEFPITNRIRLTSEEMEFCDFLLNSAIQNWGKMKTLSINNFRESFLIREGRLKENQANWELKVAGKAFDLLLDTLPWAISTIKLPWMEKSIQVEWR